MGDLFLVQLICQRMNLGICFHFIFGKHVFPASGESPMGVIAALWFQHVSWRIGLSGGNPPCLKP